MSSILSARNDFDQPAPHRERHLLTPVVAKILHRLWAHKKTIAATGLLFAVTALSIPPIKYLQIYNKINATKPNFDADLIIVPTGSRSRIPYALNHLKPNQKLFISGVGDDVTLTKLLRHYKIKLKPGVKEDQIILGYTAQTTAGNGIEVREYLEQNPQITTALVATQAALKPRTYVEMEEISKINQLAQITYASPDHPSTFDLLRTSNRKEIYDTFWRHIGRSTRRNDDVLPFLGGPEPLLEDIADTKRPLVVAEIPTENFAQPIPRHHRNSQGHKLRGMLAPKNRHQIKQASHKQRHLAVIRSALHRRP